MAEQIGLSAVFDLKDFNRGLSDYTSGLGKAERETSGMAGKMGQSWNTLGGTATKAAAVLAGAVVTAAAAAGAAIAGFAVSGIQKAKDLEAQLSSIAATLNKSAEEIAPLKQLIIDLGIDPNLKVSATEAATAIENLARNGLSMGQILDGAARSTVLLANATGADFGMAADIATDTMGIFNIKAEDMETAVNGITAVTNASKFTIQDYALALAQGGGVASAVGMEFDDFNTSITAMSALFSSGSDAGTSLKTMMLRLVPASSAAETEMSKLGLYTWNGAEAMKVLSAAGIKPVNDDLNTTILTLEDWFEQAYKVNLQTEEGAEKWNKWAIETGVLSNKFFDAQGNLKSMADVTQILHDATAGLSEEQRNQAFATIFGTDAMRAAFGLAESGAVIYTDAATAARELGVSQEAVNAVIEGGVTQFEALQLQMSQIDASEQAATRMNNLAGAVEILQGVIETLQLQIGDVFLPVLTDMVRMFTDLVSQHSGQIIGFFQTLADNISSLATYITEFIATGDPFNQFFANLSPVLAAVVLGMVAFVGIVQQAADLIANSIGKFVEWKDILLVLGAAIATTVVPAIWGMIAAMAPVALIFAGAVLVVAALRTAWETNFLGIQDITKTAMQAVQDAIGPVIVALTGLAEKTIPFLEEHWRELAAGVAAFSAVLIAAQIPALLGAIGTAASALGVVIAGLSTPVLLVAAAIGILAAAWVGDWFGIQEATYSAIGAIMGQLAPLTDAIQQFGSGALAEITAFATGNATEFENVKAIWESAKESANNLFVALVGYVTSHLSEWTAKFTEWGTAAWQWIIDATGVVTAKLGEWWTAISGYVTSHLSEWKTIFAEWTTAAWQWIVDAAGVVVTKLGEWYTALSTYIANQLPTWTTTFTNWAKAAWQWIVDAAGQVASKLGEWWTALKGALDDKLPTWITAFTDWIKAAWQWIVDAAGQVPAKLGEWYTALKGVLDDKLPTWVTAFKDWIEAAWQWILDSAALLPGKVGEWYTALKKAVDDKLPTWKTAFTGWKDAAWQWIVDSAKNFPAKIGEWYTKLTSDLGDKLPTLKTEMLKFATAMVTWIGDKAADALPELGKWLGHVIAWIPKAVIGLAIELVKLAAALIGWIMSPEANPDPEMEKFKTALGESLVKIGGGLKGFMGEFAKGFLEELGLGFLAEKDGLTRKLDELVDVMVEHLGLSDWVKYGQDILNNIRTGFESVRDAVYNGVTLVVERVKKIFNVIDEWLKIGKGILQNIWDGIISLKETVMTNIGTLIENMKTKFTSLDFWTGVGKAIIEGIKKGLEEKGQEIIDYLVGLGQKALDAIKALFGIASPSRVFAAIGEDMIDGWLIGLQNRAPQLYSTIREISGALLGIVMSHKARTLPALGSTLGDLLGVGGNFLAAVKDEAQRIADAIQEQFGIEFTDWGFTMPSPGVVLPWAEINRRSSLLATARQFEDQQRIANTLKMQTDLVELVRSAGLDVAAFFRGIRLGRDANPADLLRSMTNATRTMNDSLEAALNVATRGYDRLIETMRAGRLSFNEMIDDFSSSPPDRLGAFENQLRVLDEQIAQVEQNILMTGNDLAVETLRDLTARRQDLAGEIRRFLAQMANAQQAIDSIHRTANQEAQTAIQKYTESFIDPLMASMRSPLMAASVRDQYVQLIAQRTAALNLFIDRADQLAAIQRQMAAPISPMESALTEFYNVGTTDDRRQAIIRYMQQLNSMMALERRATQFTGELGDRFRNDVLNVLEGQISLRNISEQDRQSRLDTLTSYVNQFRSLQKVYDDLSAAVASSPLGDQDISGRFLDQFFDTNTTPAGRMQILASLSQYSSQFKALTSTYRSLSLVVENSPLSDRDISEQLLGRFFETGTTAAERTQIIASLRNYSAQFGALANIVNRLSTVVDSSPFGERDISGQFLDRFFSLSSTDAQRQAILNDLTRYAGQFRTLSDAYRDVSTITSAYPLVGRFETQVMDRLLEQFFDLNTSEAERLTIIQQYRQEQERILALQQREQQLDFLRQQLDMVNTVRQLNEQFDDIISVQDILDGITFGVNASMEDMLLLTSRVIEALIATTNYQLGISSPSKVFAKIGRRMMEGLGLGIENAASIPALALAGVGQQVPYAMTNNRTANVYMGGQVINNGMDDATFTARVRRIVEGLL